MILTRRQFMTFLGATALHSLVTSQSGECQSKIIPLGQMGSGNKCLHDLSARQWTQFKDYLSGYRITTDEFSPEMIKLKDFPPTGNAVIIGMTYFKDRTIEINQEILLSQQLEAVVHEYFGHWAIYNHPESKYQFPVIDMNPVTNTPTQIIFEPSVMKDFPRVIITPSGSKPGFFLAKDAQGNLLCEIEPFLMNNPLADLSGRPDGAWDILVNRYGLAKINRHIGQFWLGKNNHTPGLQDPDFFIVKDNTLTFQPSDFAYLNNTEIIARLFTQIACGNMSYTSGELYKNRSQKPTALQALVEEKLYNDTQIVLGQKAVKVYASLGDSIVHLINNGERTKTGYTFSEMIESLAGNQSWLLTMTKSYLQAGEEGILGAADRITSGRQVTPIERGCSPQEVQDYFTMCFNIDKVTAAGLTDGYRTLDDAILCRKKLPIIEGYKQRKWMHFVDSLVS